MSRKPILHPVCYNAITHFRTVVKLDHSYLTNVNTMTGLVDFNFFSLNVGEAMLSDCGRPFHSTLPLVSVMAW
jgi:hypothetical protein